ncbi:hypothetical protein [Dinoroseobacter sp. S375]|uniref:hypothetical protein n=1 Tax=Dinoroseobacter sp. S375 TaxID=3415136 RepID=UPI003C79A6A8
MFLELIATFVIGFGVAGVVLLLNRISGGRLPRAMLPIAAGLAMIGFTVWSEYSWYDRTVSQLPEGVEILVVHEQQTFYQPWSYVKPFVSRFLAVDLARAMRNDTQPDQVIVPLVSMERWQFGSEVPVAVDCVGSRRADLADGIEFDEVGALVDADWITVEADDPLLEAVCT